MSETNQQNLNQSAGNNEGQMQAIAAGRDVNIISWSGNPDNYNKEDKDTKTQQYGLLPRTKLRGRENDIKTILEYISQSDDQSYYLICLEGWGGVGKTAVANEVAYRCKDNNKFNVIIFIEENKDITLTLIFSIISKTLNDETIISVSPERQQDKVCQALKTKKLLLIINSFENIEEQEQNKIFNFFKNLQNHNSQAKVLITAREKVKINLQEFQFNDNNIGHKKLKPLCQNQSIELIQQLAAQKEIQITLEQCQRISKRSFGVPMAIIQIIAQLKERLKVYPNQLDPGLDEILPETSRAAKDIATVCVGQSIERIQKKKKTTAHELLLSIAIFSAPANRNAIKKVAGLEKNTESEIDEGVKQLLGVDLMEVTEEGRYKMHPLIREYIFNQEFTHYPNFQEAAQERWVKWYKNFAKDYGGKDWDKWDTEKYNYLNEEWNVLLLLLDWCKKQNRYEDIRDLWKYLKDYASVYGYWTDRLRWMDWLIVKSIERGEWFTALHCISSKAWTFIQMWELEKAENLLLSTRQLAKSEDLNVQDSLAKHIVYLYIRQGQYIKAYDELETWETEIVESLRGRSEKRHKIALQIERELDNKLKVNKNLINDAIKKDKERIARAEINILYYRGEICFLENKISMRRRKNTSKTLSKKQINVNGENGQEE